MTRSAAKGTVTCGLAQDEHDERKLVSPRWLRDRLEEVSVIDIRGQVKKLDRIYDADGVKYYQQVEPRGLKDEYLFSHIPGSVFVDWTSDIVDKSSGGLFNLIDVDGFRQCMEERGVSCDKTVVIYDNGDMLYAARLWFAMVLYGHPDVRLLNGGFSLWEEQGLPTSDDSRCMLTLLSEFNPDRTYSSMLMSMSDILSKKSEANLIDARSKVQYDGIQRRATRGGHIPGAISLDRRRLLNEDGSGFLPPSELRQVFEDVGVRANDRPTIAYCNGGVASTLVLFALHLLDVPLDKLFNYDGSWNEYGSHASNPPLG
eukprot:CAMPEP_0113967224 /NCGR_PEP_ID=MMETSP0011_2-20120614/8798_1 /TAXON_ID=101924 /ORGANISM="Rhodosorus marinus" /LENGTH=314 /DNA_ID=CAMNT_0000980057 /DNA_START=93 /DNA_END=1037 /DNA_ORIENTATION=- /assembly_acc=CAM_ASM_000156